MKWRKKMRNIVVASANDVVDGMHCSFGVAEFVADALEAMPHSPIAGTSKHSDHHHRQQPSIFVDIGGMVALAFVDEHWLNF
jgi:hypothetical protein